MKKSFHFQNILTAGLALLLLMLIDFQPAKGQNPPAPPCATKPPPSDTNPPPKKTVNGITGITNFYCVGDTITASVDYTNIVGSNNTYSVDSDCNVVTQSSPCGYGINSAKSHWTAHVGTWMANGTGVTPSFTPTNYGSGTLDIHVAWVNSCDGSSDGDDPPTARFTVVSLTNQCVATIPTNQARLKIGVAEAVTLTLLGGSASTTWTLSGGGDVYPRTGASVTFTAPHTKDTCTITAICPGISGCNSKTFTVVEPDGCDTSIFSAANFPSNVAGVNDVKLALKITPKDVSFSKVEIIEIACIATNATGYFADPNVYNPDNLDHGKCGAGRWFPAEPPTPGVVLTDKLNCGPLPQYICGVCSQPLLGGWSYGHYTWPIPAGWRVQGDSGTNSLKWSDQDFTIQSDGEVTINKFGHTATRNTNAVYTTLK